MQRSMSMAKVLGEHGQAGSGGQREHTLYVPAQVHKLPLALHLLQSAQAELSESHHRLDDPEHRLGRAFTQRVARSALGSFEAVTHADERISVVGQGRRLLMPLARVRMMCLTSRGDE